MQGESCAGKIISLKQALREASIAVGRLTTVIFSEKQQHSDYGDTLVFEPALMKLLCVTGDPIMHQPHQHFIFSPVRVCSWIEISGFFGFFLVFCVHLFSQQSEKHSKHPINHWGAPPRTDKISVEASRVNKSDLN